MTELRIGEIGKNAFSGLVGIFASSACGNEKQSKNLLWHDNQPQMGEKTNIVFPRLHGVSVHTALAIVSRTSKP